MGWRCDILVIDQHVGGQPSHGCKVYHHIHGNCSLYHTLGGIKVAAQPFIHVHTHQCNGDDHGCREIANEADYPSSAAATEPTRSREQRAYCVHSVHSTRRQLAYIGRSATARPVAARAMDTSTTPGHMNRWPYPAASPGARMMMAVATKHKESTCHTTVHTAMSSGHASSGSARYPPAGQAN